MIYFAEKMRGHEYVEALEEEKRKIQVFQRELPLCLELVNQAIGTCKQQMSGSTTATECMHGGQSQSESECSEDTSSEAPALQDLFSLKMCSSNSDDDVAEQHTRKDEDHKNSNNNDQTKKVDWLRSAGLWNPSPSDPPSKEDVPKKACVIEPKRNGGAFQPFNREKCAVRTSVAQPPASKTPPCAIPVAEMRGNGSNKKDEKGQNQRKQRRCWSPELHRRFLNALQQLGGSHVATPKQIRELMNVDGLTNDEVKSHLQKYRLHTRRPSPAVQNNGTPQASQFVVVGGIWMPPSSEYAATIAGPSASGEASNVTTANCVYAPVAAPAPAPKVEKVLSASLCQNARQSKSESLHSEERGSHSEGLTRSNSPATSSSTHTTTASPLF